jgi:hypothetical protein
VIGKTGTVYEWLPRYWTADAHPIDGAVRGLAIWSASCEVYHHMLGNLPAWRVLQVDKAVVARAVQAWAAAEDAPRRARWAALPEDVTRRALAQARWQLGGWRGE